MHVLGCVRDVGDDLSDDAVEAVRDAAPTESVLHLDLAPHSPRFSLVSGTEKLRRNLQAIAPRVLSEPGRLGGPGSAGDRWAGAL